MSAFVVVLCVVGGATIGVCLSIMSYARGYRAGVRYCIGQLGPLSASSSEILASLKREDA